MKIRIVFKRLSNAADFTDALLFEAVTDEAGTPLDVGEVGLPDGVQWLADGDHEAIEIDTEKLR